tara:strand:- start:6165 stop:6833 length:669 start_codon:yes stop_codon:yes gene_type:complete
MIKKSKIFEVYEELGKKRKLFTINLTPKKTAYNENLIIQDNQEFREWEPYKSKLASLILKGSPNIFIRKNDKVLYLGASTGTTVSHVSDIVGPEGLIFAVDLAPRVLRELIFLSYNRKNIIPILEDASKTSSLKERISLVDVIYQDIAQKDQVRIFLKNVNLFLKEKGYAILALKSRSIDVTKRPKEVYREVLKELEKHLTVIDYRVIDPFQKDHAMFICKN